MFRRIAVTMVIFSLAVSSAGCWGKTELNEIGIVTVTGVDYDPDGSIRMTVMSVQPEGPANTAPVRSSTWIGTATGKNLMDASKNLRSIAVKDLTWIHNSVIVIGKAAAQQKMNEVIDFFSRNREVRFNSYILVADGTAFDMMQIPPDIQSDLSKEILGMIDNVDEWSKSYVANAKEFLVSHTDNCGNYVTGRLAQSKESRTTFSAPRENYEKMALLGKDIPLAYIEGCAVFRQGKMIGWLDSVETRGYLWITGKIMSGSIITEMDGGTVSMENNFSSTSVELKPVNGELTAHIKVDTRGTLVEQTTSHELKKEEAINDIEQKIAGEITKEIKTAVKKAQDEYKTDIFRIGGKLHKEYPELWRQLGSDWDDAGFPKVKFSYSVNVTIERTGKLLKSVY